MIRPAPVPAAHDAPFLTADLRDEAATAGLAAAIGARLRPGDTILLDGPVGAGKTAFARALIQSLLDAPEDVPSPTFTLVQTYDTRAGPIWHADLYRIGTTTEIEELGLADALAEAICLIEWPDRLGPLSPPTALGLHLAPDPARAEARCATFRSAGPDWPRRLAGLGDG